MALMQLHCISGDYEYKTPKLYSERKKMNTKPTRIIGIVSFSRLKCLAAGYL